MSENASGGHQQEERHRPGVSRRYKSASIQVNWEPQFCIHASHCWRNLPGVFRPRAVPWITPEGASADEIAWVVSACPTGALSYERLDGGPEEPAPSTATIEPQPDGPVYVRGRLRIALPDGKVREATRAALCRCGASEHKPFCDLSHSRIGFRAD